MGELSEGQARRHASDLIGLAAVEGFEESLSPSDIRSPECGEAQNVLRVAKASAIESIMAASTLNRVIRTSESKQLRGNWTHPAQDCLRSAVLFAGAGLDHSLKQLINDALPRLVEIDEKVSERLSEFGRAHLSSANTDSIDPRSLVKILLAVGESPRQVFVRNWCYQLTSGSAQSAARVSEIAGALGVTTASLRKRIAPTNTKSSKLEKAFIARNQISHELDIVTLSGDTRKPFERMQRTRKIADVKTMVSELLEVVQLIITDVDDRVTPLA